MRKCDKMKFRGLIDDGSWRTKNVRFRFYRLFHEALRESHDNTWTTSKRYKRKAVINECLYIPVSTLLNTFDKDYTTTISLGGGCSIPFESIKEIRIF